MEEPIRVLIADDHSILREGIRMLIEGEPDIQVVGEASNGEEAVRKVGELVPDVVLMDIAMPVLGGLEATERIRADHPNVRVLALTMHENERYVFQILRAGAMGYILKKAAARELITAIRLVHRGESFLYPSVATKVVAEYFWRQDPRNDDSSFEILTDRERQILKCICEGHTSKEIADLLKVSTRTVQVHRANIMKKLKVNNTVSLVKYAARQGLIQINGL